MGRTTKPTAGSGTPATTAKQDEQTALLNTIDADTSAISSVKGTTADAASAVGGTGTDAAKLRLMTTLLDAIKTAVEVLDNVVSGSEAQVDIVGALPAGTNNIGDVDVLTVPADPFGTNADAAATAGGTGSMQAKLRTLTGDLDAIKTAVQIMDDWDNAASDGASVSGDVAHDSADAGEPVKMGGKAVSAIPTAVNANDRVNAQYDLYGRQVTIESLREMKDSQITTITASTAETTIVTADATYKLDLYGIIVVNTSATATEISVKDSTAGTTRFWTSVPANDQRGFMATPSAAHKQAAANNNWTATCADSVSSIIITALFVKNL